MFLTYRLIYRVYSFGFRACSGGNFSDFSGLFGEINHRGKNSYLRDKKGTAGGPSRKSNLGPFINRPEAARFCKDT